MSDEWVQDPDGGWHLRPEPPDRSNLVLAIVFVLTLLAAGGIGWKWKHDHDEAERRTAEMTCVMSGGRYCDDEPRRP